MNIAILGGRLTEDPKILTTGTGAKFATLSLATNQPGGIDKDTGKRKQWTQFHRITVWDERTAEALGKFAKKGSTWIEVKGSIETRKYQAEGRDCWITEIVVRNGFDLHFHQVEKRLNGADGEGVDSGGDEAPAGDHEFGQHAPRSNGNGKRAALDDDIPF